MTYTTIAPRKLRSGIKLKSLSLCEPPSRSANRFLLERVKERGSSETPKKMHTRRLPKNTNIPKPTFQASLCDHDETEAERHVKAGLIPYHPSASVNWKTLIIILTFMTTVRLKMDILNPKRCVLTKANRLDFTFNLCTCIMCSRKSSAWSTRPFILASLVEQSTSSMKSSFFLSLRLAHSVGNTKWTFRHSPCQTISTASTVWRWSFSKRDTPSSLKMSSASSSSMLAWSTSLLFSSNPPSNQPPPPLSFLSSSGPSFCSSPCSSIILANFFPTSPNTRSSFTILKMLIVSAVFKACFNLRFAYSSRPNARFPLIICFAIIMSVFLTSSNLNFNIEGGICRFRVKWIEMSAPLLSRRAAMSCIAFEKSPAFSL
mmetsp:Transcript_7449/g.15003  ORF Transcript_7449/g.15003 Transcript_7449/m.15003 type:complete len:374 (+) Transcript_7449:962-2083(+)